MDTDLTDKHLEYYLQFSRLNTYFEHSTEMQDTLEA